MAADDSPPGWILELMRNNRPFLLWLISLIFLAAAFIELLQTIRTVSSWNILMAVQYQPGPFVLLFSSEFFFLIFLVCAVILWARLSWAPAFAGAGTILFSIWFWLYRLVLSIDPQPMSNQVFNIIVFVLILGLILASLWMLRPFMKEPNTNGLPESTR
jgi:hypothetical protein